VIKSRFIYLKSNQVGAAHKLLILTMTAIIGFAFIGSLNAGKTHASTDSLAIKSGISGACLDDHDSNPKAGAEVDGYKCNNTDAQAWTYGNLYLKHDSYCLSIENDSTAFNAAVVLNPCSQDSPGQLWLSDDGRAYNPNDKLCLTSPESKTGQQLVMSNCSSPVQANQQWALPTLDCSAQVGRSTRVACYAEQEWETWQSGSSSHESLLNTYTDGAPYEEWCADFASYVYKEAGYPFVNGEADGWDESNANLVQNQGFTEHDPSNYTPQPGDVAFFDYTGGHVEIVVSGGKHPTYIYGNSATIDPTTGNGEMEANTITKDGSLGSLVYYLSPN
jgi:hypothetical protein